MTHDYKAALDCITRIEQDSRAQGSIGICDSELADKLWSRIDTIRHALLIADKLMQEPSKSVCDVGSECADVTDYGPYGGGLDNPDRVFKAMRDQLLKEVVND